MTQPLRSSALHLALASLALAAIPCAAITGGSVHAGFLGAWVPLTAACTSPLKLVIDAGSVSFVNAGQRADFRKLEQCFSCAGHNVQGITMLSTDAMGDSPFMITLDESKQGRKAMTVDLSNDQKLATRFPFGKAGLKKCS